MENQIKVDDTIFWWGDYNDGINENGTHKTKYLSGVNKVAKINLYNLGDKYFELDNGKFMFYDGEHENWELVKPDNIEKCILCGQETPYLFDTPIDLRNYYIDGGGQLCKQCYIKIYSR